MTMKEFETLQVGELVKLNWGKYTNEVFRVVKKCNGCYVNVLLESINENFIFDYKNFDSKNYCCDFNKRRWFRHQAIKRV